MGCLREAALLPLLFLAFVTLAASRRCCPDDEVFTVHGRRCANSTDVTLLHCPKGKYLLNPERDADDNFTVLPNDTLVFNRHSVEDTDKYCVTILEYKNGSRTANDVAFVCFADVEPREPESGIIAKATRHQIMGGLIYTSVLFMLLTILVYVVLPEMRDLEGKCLLGAIASFTIAFTVLGTLQFAGQHLSNNLCTFTAFFQYFWMLSPFFWLNVIAFNMWNSVVRCHDSEYPESKLLVKYCAYGWGCPLVFLVAAIITHHVPDEYQLLRPNFGQTSCWFRGSLETWIYFYGPVALLISCNVFFFVWTAWKLWRDCRDQTATKLSSLRFKCVLYVKLLVVMGIPWIFELLSFQFDKKSDSYFWFATDIMNGLQGILIFLITVVCRKRVLKGLRQHRSFGINWPKKWAAVGDEESHAILPNEDGDNMSSACVAAKILA